LAVVLELVPFGAADVLSTSELVAGEANALDARLGAPPQPQAKSTDEIRQLHKRNNRDFPTFV
jgi:hypothetical protein